MVGNLKKECVEKIIKKYFTNYKIKERIENTKEVYDITILCNYGEYTDSIFTINKNDNFINVDLLNKCKNIATGSEILEKIKTIGKKLKCKYIKLIDGSAIVFEIKNSEKYYIISLAYLKILIDGQSWYNKMGFISNNFTNETSYNDKIRKIPIMEFIDESKKRIDEKKKEPRLFGWIIKEFKTIYD